MSTNIFFQKTRPTRNKNLQTEIYINDIWDPTTKSGKWAFVISSQPQIICNNKLNVELDATILHGIMECLSHIPIDTNEISIITNNLYLRLLVNEWLEKWHYNDFMSRPNRDLLKLLYDTVKKYKIHADIQEIHPHTKSTLNKLLNK